MKWEPLVCEICGKKETIDVCFDGLSLCPECCSSRRICSKCGEPESSGMPFPERGRMCKGCISDYNAAYYFIHREEILPRNIAYQRQYEPHPLTTLQKEKYAERRVRYPDMTYEQKEAHRRANREWRRRRSARQKAEKMG